MGAAIFTGVSGLLAHQRRMDVIANNIANVNTTGFRGSRVLFQDLLSQTLSGARGALGDYGGTNPKQVGLGVGLASIDVNHSQGSLQSTGFTGDIAVQGNGFFVLRDGGALRFTRDGSFTLNPNGELIDPATGALVQGYLADADGVVDPNQEITNIVIPVGGTAIARATTVATLTGNLSSEATSGDTVIRNIQVYDSLGELREVQLTFTRQPQQDVGGTLYNAWNWEAAYTNDDTPPTTTTVGSGTVLFDSDGAFYDEGTVAGGVFTPRAPGVPEISIPQAAFGALETFPAVPFEFELDFSAVTELAADSDLTVSTQDGFPPGILQTFSVGMGGVINGVFSNGLTRTIGQVALATFANDGGLARVANNMFRSTSNSGSPRIGVAGSGGRGDVIGGVLERSNVDLATEFSNLIITQRGFQANARTITTADTLLQETVNLIR